MESDGRRYGAEKVRCREIVPLYHFNHAVGGWILQQCDTVDESMRVSNVEIANDG